MDKFTGQDKVYSPESLGGWDLPTSYHDGTLGFDFSWDSIGDALAPIGNKLQTKLQDKATAKIGGLLDKTLADIGLGPVPLPNLSAGQVPGQINIQRTVTPTVQRIYQDEVVQAGGGGMSMNTKLAIGGGVGFMALMMMMMMMRSGNRPPPITARERR